MNRAPLFSSSFRVDQGCAFQVSERKDENVERENLEEQVKVSEH